MHDRKGIVLHQLRAEETDLLARLNQVRKALSVLGETETRISPKRPQCRADLLREYLLERPEGVRAKDVPAILKAMGHSSLAAHESINWLSPSQLPPGKRYFTRRHGIITLRPEFCCAFRQDPKTPVRVAPPTSRYSHDQPGLPHETDSRNGDERGASIGGVNKPCTLLAERALDGKPC
jgi:hypothetical protein